MRLPRGRCLNNAQMRGGETKLGVYRRHRFCLVMENALSHDYVSEKLWDAFAGGCVPVYYVRGHLLHFFLGSLPMLPGTLPFCACSLSFPWKGLCCASMSNIGTQVFMNA